MASDNRYKLFATSMAAFVALAACSSAQMQGNASTPDSPKTWKLEWTAAPGNSVLHASDVTTDAGHLGQRRRCWRRAGRLDCIRIDQIGETYNLRRYHAKDLVQGGDADPSNASLAGYSCSFYASFSGVEEKLAGEGDFLEKNTVLLDGSNSRSKPWTAAYVAAYLAENRIVATDTHFDCTELAGQLVSGSLDTIGTTSVMYEQLMR